ncbi:glycine cleavage system H-protein subunit [Pichia californica]|uniref:Glycine cleavage system H protein n=1 Tax=Pichia californica TaxID=460514 RepID=A0A9P7BCZ1_9ASCO|nr:glycine cleavage system H-protein subunit [[Candida] californica]KAG0687497.1 glycine cleavage system H-protein subunit [[Candida] californica]
MFTRSFFKLTTSTTTTTIPKNRINFINLIRLQSTFKLNNNSIVSNYSKSPILKFTNEHEWISIHPDGTGFIGITNYASDALGDATFIELPIQQIGEEIKNGETISSVESVKSASDIYSPVDGKIIEVNEKLDDSPDLINSDPMGDGWIVKIKIDNNDPTLNDLMDVDSYKTFVENSDH